MDLTSTDTAVTGLEFMGSVNTELEIAELEIAELETTELETTELETTELKLTKLKLAESAIINALAATTDIVEAKRTAEIRRAAMDLLARREHSVQELHTKLCRRFTDSKRSSINALFSTDTLGELNLSDLVDDQIQILVDNALQSDQRFAEVFVRSRHNKGQGPLRIANELRQKGITEHYASAAFDAHSFDWYAAIEQLSSNKYGDSKPEDEKQKARRFRFFQYRGFSFDHINSVV